MNMDLSKNQLDENPVRISEEIAINLKKMNMASDDINKERQYACRHGCGRDFSDTSTLKSHILKLHSLEKCHICPYALCGKKYAHEYKLKTHIKCRHEKNFPVGKHGRQESNNPNGLKRRRTTSTRLNKIPSLVGKATVFTFKEDSAASSTFYSCAFFKSVYNFLVPPEHKEFYKWVVETHGHIPSTEVLSERNLIIMATRVLLDAAVAMRNLGDACPSEKEWAAWKEAFILPRTLKFNISWLEALLAEIEERRNSRRRLLPGEIAQLKKEVESIKQELKEYKATEVRLATEATIVAAQIATANTSLAEKERSLVEKESEFSSFP